MALCASPVASTPMPRPFLMSSMTPRGSSGCFISGLRFPSPTNLIFPRYTSLWSSLLLRAARNLHCRLRQAALFPNRHPESSCPRGRSRRLAGDGLAVSVPAYHGKDVRGVDGQIPVVAGEVRVRLGEGVANGPQVLPPVRPAVPFRVDKDEIPALN